MISHGRILTSTISQGPLICKNSLDSAQTTHININNTFVHVFGIRVQHVDITLERGILDYKKIVRISQIKIPLVSSRTVVQFFFPIAVQIPSNVFKHLLKL